jgi:glycosyltransferase involved in cell wall biosynthesis
MNRTRLAFNARLLMSPHTGIASYIRNLGTALQDSGEVDLFLFNGFGWSREIRGTPMPGIEPLKTWVKRLIPRPYALVRRIQQRRFSAGARSLDLNLYHETSFLPFRFDGPKVITVHDLSTLRYPETHPAARVREVAERLPQAIREADAIVVDSAFIKSELIKEFNVDPAKVTDIHLGVAPQYRPQYANDIAATLVEYGLSYRHYILAVGTLEPRKNLLQALDAHAGLPEQVRRKFPLVVAGTKGWLARELEARIHAAEVREEVRWLGYVPPEALPAIYAGARLFVYPSLYEGFGLPVLEAMASGIPVVTSGLASLPEVAGDAGVLVDPHDRDALRDAMLRMIEDETHAQLHAEFGLKQAAKFTWRDCALKTLAVYRKAIEAANGNRRST